MKGHKKDKTMIDIKELEEILEQRKDELTGIYGDLGGAISGVLKLIRMDEMNVMREDCYYYTEDMDMGAIIKTCLLQGTFGSCPCNGCDKFISKYDVFKIVKEHTSHEDQVG